MIGEGPGAGFNINVPWENGRCGDADYIAVWDHILVPVAKEFDPDIIILSAGFDAGLYFLLPICVVRLVFLNFILGPYVTGIQTICNFT